MQILLRERSQAEKAPCCVFQGYNNLEKAERCRREKNKWLPGSRGKGRWISGAQRVLGQGSYLCDAVMGTHGITRRSKLATPRVNPDVK